MNSDLAAKQGVHRGRQTVFAMFGFAVLMIALLFSYWHFYTAPFRTLQYAIAEEFVGSSPRVVGGKHKSHRTENPTVLRIVAYVPEKDFNPEQATVQSENRAEIIAQLAFTHHDLSQYEVMEIILLQKVPEGTTRRWKTSRTITEWQEIAKQTDVVEAR